MDASILVAVIAGAFAFLNLVLTSWWKRSSDRRARELDRAISQERDERQQQYQVQMIKLQDELAQRSTEESREWEAQELMRTYHDPLLRSAVDLQSKLFNILRLHLLDKFYNNGTEIEKEYTIENTLYVIAEFLGWVEIVRREVQFIDLGNDGENRALVRLLDSISESFLSSGSPETFRIFRGEQRAVGELMMIFLPAEGGLWGTDARLPSPSRPSRRECIGYATFLENQEKPSVSRWFRKLRDDIDELAKGHGHPERLISLQNALMDLIGNLDPEGLKYPMDRRAGVTAGEVSIP